MRWWWAIGSATGCWDIDVPLIDFDIATAPEAALACLIFVYVIAAAFNMRIPHTGVAMKPDARLASSAARFWTCNARLWRDKLGQISPTTTLFWVRVQSEVHRSGMGRGCAGLSHQPASAALQGGGDQDGGRGRCTRR